MKLKTKFTISLGLSIGLFGLIMLILFSIFVFKENVHIKRYKLRLIAEQVDSLMSEFNKLPIEEQKEKLAVILPKGLPFSVRPRRLSYSVFSLDHKPIISSSNLRHPLKIADAPRTDKNYFSDYRFDFKENLTTDYCYWGKNCIVVLKHIREFEIGEDIVTFSLISVAIMALLAVVVSRKMANTIIDPIRRISRVAKKIALGNLKARVNTSSYYHDEFKKLEHDLNYTFNEFEASFTKVSEFSHDIAHELRTPLTIMQGNIEVALRQSRCVEEYQSILNDNLQELSKIRKITDDILLLAKPFAFYPYEQFRPCNISETLTSSINDISFIADSKKIKITTNIEPNLIFNCIETFLYRAFFNLLNNSIKFSVENSNIEISLVKHEKIYQFAIADEAGGISEEDIPHIFNKFYKTKNNNTRGSGLGLSIVKWICELHEGTVSVVNNAKGCEFIIELPLK